MHPVQILTPVLALGPAASGGLSFAFSLEVAQRYRSLPGEVCSPERPGDGMGLACSVRYSLLVAQTSGGGVKSAAGDGMITSGLSMGPGRDQLTSVVLSGRWCGPGSDRLLCVLSSGRWSGPESDTW